MNVLLVTIDCLRQDRCGIYEHHRNTTPTLDALAREGFVYENAYATGPVTTESFPGILAGRLSAQTVAGDNLYQKGIPDGEPTIASHLREKGYGTVGVISNPRIGRHVGSDRGFEVFKNLRTNDKSGNDGGFGFGSFTPKMNIGNKLYTLREHMRNQESVPLRYELPFLSFRGYQHLTGWPSIRGEKVVDTFLDELSDISSPFFGWTHLMDVHGPIHPDVVTEGGLDNSGIISQFRSHAKRVSDIHDVHTEARYDSAVRYVDHQLERIIDWLKNADLWDETTLIVTSDHGDALYDRGLYGHPQHYMYDELTKVPMLVRVPDVNGCRIARSFSLGWLHEMITELTESECMHAPLHSEHHSHFESKKEGGVDDQLVFIDSISPRGHSVVVRNQDMKYVEQSTELIDDDYIDIQPKGTYDTHLNPKERNPIATEIPNLAQEARQLLIDPTDLEREYPDSIDSSVKDRLKQLGYSE